MWKVPTRYFRLGPDVKDFYSTDFLHHLHEKRCELATIDALAMDPCRLKTYKPFYMFSDIGFHDKNVAEIGL